MSAQPNPQPSRPRREIARELAQETNRKHITEPAYELSRAIDEQVHRVGVNWTDKSRR
jgi:hypothetical protein